MALLPSPAPGNNAENIIYLVVYSLLTNVVYALVLVNIAAFIVVYISSTWGLWERLANFLIGLVSDHPNPRQREAAEIFLRFSAPPFSFSLTAMIIVLVITNITIPSFTFSVILSLFH